jgi:hypothetical protein
VRDSTIQLGASLVADAEFLRFAQTTNSGLKSKVRYQQLPPATKAIFDERKLRFGFYRELSYAQECDIFKRVQLGVVLTPDEQENASTSDYKLWIDELISIYSPESTEEQCRNPQSFSPVSSENSLELENSITDSTSRIDSESSNSGTGTRVSESFSPSRLRSSTVTPEHPIELPDRDEKSSIQYRYLLVRLATWFYESSNDSRDSPSFLNYRKMSPSTSGPRLRRLSQIRELEWSFLIESG